MSDEQKNIVNENEEYWKKMDELYATADKKNLMVAINRTDTEKFHLFTRMLRLNNTLKKMVPNKK